MFMFTCFLGGDTDISTFWSKTTVFTMLGIPTMFRGYYVRLLAYRVIQNDCRGSNNLSYTIHLR